MDDIKKILVGINWPLNDDQIDDIINRTDLRKSIVSDINDNPKFGPIGIRISTSNGLQIFEKSGSNETLVGLELSLPNSDQNPGFNDPEVDGTVDNNGQVNQKDTSKNVPVSQITVEDKVDIKFNNIYLGLYSLGMPERWLTVRNDTAGSGYFGASRRRNGKPGTHQGVDFITGTGWNIYSPITGTVQQSFPYGNDEEWTGLTITGINEYQGYTEDGNERTHAGIDFITQEGWNIYSPIDGTIQQSFPYKGDNDWTGLTITGTGKYEGYQVKMWYFTPIKTSGTVDEGSYLGLAAAISERYPGSPSMQDHIHLEVRKNGNLVDPLPYFV